MPEGLLKRAGLCLALVVLAGKAVAADTVRCADADGAVGASIVVTFADNARTNPVAGRVDIRLPDFALSTEAGGDGPAERITSQVGEDDRLEVYLSDAEDVWIVAALRLFRAASYVRQFGDETGEEASEPAVVAGTLAAMNAGVWAVTCTGW